MNTSIVMLWNINADAHELAQNSANRAQKCFLTFDMLVIKVKDNIDHCFSLTTAER